MKPIELNAILREKLGKKTSVDLRKKELIPCELYGGGENFHLTIEEKSLKKMVFTPYTHYAILNFNDVKKKAVIKEIQFNPISDRINHVDFLEIDENKPLVANLPVKVSGLAAGVKAGGRLVQEMRTIKVKGLLKDMVEIIEVNVENLELDKSIHTSEINIPNLTIVEHADKAVVSVKTLRAVVEETPVVAEGTKAAEGTETAEGTEVKAGTEAAPAKETKK
jgi:large subunit ribosomal protein L25